MPHSLLVLWNSASTREKRETAKQRVCVVPRNCRVLKLKVLKTQPRCTKQSCPPPRYEAMCRGSLANPTQARSVDGHVASREHQSLHANQTVDAVEGRWRNSPKHQRQLAEMRWVYPNQSTILTNQPHKTTSHWFEVRTAEDLCLHGCRSS